MARLTHVDDAGDARMVDVGGKPATSRRAVARGRVRFGREAFDLLKENRLRKGDALGTARLAGIQAGKRTADWIPLCHQVPLDHLDVTIDLEEVGCEAMVTATAEARWPTGVEMEAMVAVSAACLTLYDMAKGVDRSIEITGIELMEKSGGRTGLWRRDGENA
ncbi:MAG: cyclic pyranopterin monophosphate synthase MoaC [Acidobacteria bacterium]|uniref:Cyclic pyranopterin monophosphate synthase n=1 Tax=Candidatus Polarisedimenticola svalbardensis TaxID=2886004 RepID=A0A8J7CJS6_9BACT|nr:cyclic pyranopterin monophosphate synthase MoaC [Candidatus Polarisedimenticola svalbardensis]